MTHSSTSPSILKKSEEMRIEITLLLSRFGIGYFASKSEAGAVSLSLADLRLSWAEMYFISQSKIWTSQCTEMSMSSKLLESLRYF